MQILIVRENFPSPEFELTIARSRRTPGAHVTPPPSRHARSFGLTPVRAHRIYYKYSITGTLHDSTLAARAAVVVVDIVVYITRWCLLSNGHCTLHDDTPRAVILPSAGDGRHLHYHYQQHRYHNHYQQHHNRRLAFEKFHTRFSIIW